MSGVGHAALAALPILLLFALLIGARWSAAAAGAAGVVCALPIIWHGFGISNDAFLRTVGGAAAEAGFTTLSILWIIFGALAVHEYQTRTGATDTFARWFASFGNDRRIAVVLVAWFFALFLEGAAGFGAPVALAAPLLVGLGLQPVTALTLALLGHAAGVSFGAVGTPILPLLAAHAAGPLDPATVVAGIAAVHAALGWGLLALVYRAGGSDVQRPSGRDVAVVGVAAAAFFVPSASIAAFVGPELPTLGGAALGTVAFAAFARRLTGEQAPQGARASMLRAALPYLVIIALILVTRLLPDLALILRDARVSWRLDGGFAGSIAPFSHPGTMLVAGLALACATRGRRGFDDALQAARAAAYRLPRVAIALVAVLVLARLMVHGGLVHALAQTAAASIGGGWPLVAPALGALGSFVTGSATASNILFADLQYATAASAAISPALAAVAQGVGSAIGNVVAPHNIVAGAATVGLVGVEGLVLRRTVGPCLAYVAAAGLLLFAVSRI